MIYKVEVKNNVRIITAKVDKKYHGIIADGVTMTLPLSVEDGTGKRGYKPIQCRFIVNEKNKLMEFNLPVTMDRISGVEIMIVMIEHNLGNLIK